MCIPTACLNIETELSCLHMVDVYWLLTAWHLGPLSSSNNTRAFFGWGEGVIVSPHPHPIGGSLVGTKFTVTHPPLAWDELSVVTAGYGMGLGHGDVFT